MRHDDAPAPALKPSSCAKLPRLRRGAGCLEALEQRVAPAAIVTHWVGLSGNWTDPAHWDAGVPNNADGMGNSYTAIIDVGALNPVVTIDSHIVVSSLTNAEAIQVNANGSAEVGDVHFAPGALDNSAGSISVARERLVHDHRLGRQLDDGEAGRDPRRRRHVCAASGAGECRRDALDRRADRRVAARRWVDHRREHQRRARRQRLQARRQSNRRHPGWGDAQRRSGRHEGQHRFHHGCPWPHAQRHGHRGSLRLPELRRHADFGRHGRGRLQRRRGERVDSEQHGGRRRADPDHRQHDDHSRRLHAEWRSADRRQRLPRHRRRRHHHQPRDDLRRCLWGDAVPQPERDRESRDHRGEERRHT